jgi:hypothetical protein
MAQSKTGHRGEVKTLFHATSVDSATKIMLSQQFGAGSGGNYGAGLYLA